MPVVTKTNRRLFDSPKAMMTAENLRNPNIPKYSIWFFPEME